MQMHDVPRCRKFAATPTRAGAPAFARGIFTIRRFMIIDIFAIRIYAPAFIHANRRREC